MPNRVIDALSGVSMKWRRLGTARRLLPNNRPIQGCVCWALGPFAEVWRSALRESAAFRSVQTCKQVWACPVCSSRIMAGRSEEATDAVTQHLANGGTVRLLTFTASHTREDTLGSLVNKHAAAHKWFWQARSVVEALKRSGSIGRITGQEVTYGDEAGWHPHRHVLLFIEGMSDDDEARLKHRWVQACESVGLVASFERGLDVRGGDERIGSYLAKLGMEVALVQAKRGRISSLTQFGMLDLAEFGDQHAGALFREFVATMKGKRSLWWSKGLKARFGIDEVTDGELVDAKADQDEHEYARLHRNGLRCLSRYATQGDFLALCGADELAAARSLLISCGGDPGMVESIMSPQEEPTNAE